MTPPQAQQRFTHEIEHGKLLAAGDPEVIWGWGTPAGKVRAARRAAYIAQGAGLAPGVRAIEIGCGTGNFTQRLAAFGSHIIAVDLSPELLAQARARGLDAQRIRFVEKPFEQCEVDGPFDAVIGSSVLHHLDQESAFNKMFALLKPGGRFSFCEPNLLNPQVALERLLAGKPGFRRVSPDETAFIRWKLAKKLTSVGFVDIAIKPYDWLHPSTPRAVIGVVSWLGGVLERVPGLRELAGSLWITARKPDA